MTAQMLAALALVASIGSGPLAEQTEVAVKVGDKLAIILTDDLAKEYARRTSSTDKAISPGTRIEAIASIEQMLDDGRVRIEHTSYVNRDGRKSRLVTLSATIGAHQIELSVTPKGTLLYASPGANSRPAAEAIRTLRLKLSDFKGLKLRTWNLSDEIGD